MRRYLYVTSSRTGSGIGALRLLLPEQAGRGACRVRPVSGGAGRCGESIGKSASEPSEAAEPEPSCADPGIAARLLLLLERAG
jgi:hypothetical protein